MKTFHLSYSELPGQKVQLGEINFMLVFQVNCPGCFLYGLPVMNQLKREFGDRVNFMGLSTGFEDFDLNTEDNTIALVQEGKLIGETQKALAQHNYHRFPQPINFPIAMDRLEDHPAFIIDQNVEIICRHHPEFPLWPEFEQMALRERVREYLIRIPKISHTFTLNQFRGTPTFVLFNDQKEILGSWFGHQPPEELSKAIQSWL